MFLTGIREISKINWAKSHLWDIKFYAEKPYNIKAPFDKWFPAVDVEENVLSLESYQFDAFLSTYKVPKSTTIFDIKVTFLDDINHTLLNWLKDWVNKSILNEDKSSQYVSRLGDPGVVRTIQIAKLNGLHEQIPGGVSSYQVYPEGSLYWHGSSAAEPEQYMMNFIIVGKAKI